MKRDFRLLDPLKGETDYTHYCAHCGSRLKRLSATENLLPHRCDEEGIGIFGVAFGPELRPMRWSARLVELFGEEDEGIPIAGGPHSSGYPDDGCEL